MYLRIPIGIMDLHTEGVSLFAGVEWSGVEWSGVDWSGLDWNLSARAAWLVSFP